MGLVNSQRLPWAYAFSTLFGIGTAVTTVIPGKGGAVCEDGLLTLFSIEPKPVRETVSRTNQLS
jgi:hypothetical protein